jgi:hypothetical protein
MTEASRSIVIICEAPADQGTACALADRVLSDAVDWMVPEMLEAFRQWRGLRRSEPFLAWKHVHTRAREAGIRTNGFFEGEPGGFTPLDEEERARAERLRQELGFDPCAHAEGLTAEHPGAKRDAKRVLSYLTGGDEEVDREATWMREVICMKESSLAQLEERGQATGLAEFIQEIRAKLVPLWTGHSGRGDA